MRRFKWSTERRPAGRRGGRPADLVAQCSIIDVAPEIHGDNCAIVARRWRVCKRFQIAAAAAAAAQEAGGRPRRSQSISAQSGVKWRRPGGLSAAEVGRYVPAI